MSWELATAGLELLARGIEDTWRKDANMTPITLTAEINVLFERIVNVIDCVDEESQSSVIAEAMQFFRGERDNIIRLLPGLEFEETKVKKKYDILHSIKNIRHGLTVLMKEKAPPHSHDEVLEGVFYDSVRPRLASESK